MRVFLLSALTAMLVFVIGCGKQNEANWKLMDDDSTTTERSSETAESADNSQEEKNGDNEVTLVPYEKEKEAE